MSSGFDQGRAWLTAWAEPSIAWLHRQPLLAVAFGAAVIMAVADITANPAILSEVLGDTDDAARLIQVRELIAGQAWFDPRLGRFGGAEPLISHWSRLIDLPLAALILLFSTVLSQDLAETVTRMVWPTILCGVIAFIVGRFCEWNSNRSTALLALLLAVPCTGHFQFTPGRIDHHNAMIIGAIGGTLCLIAALSRPKLGWLAGALLGLGCAVGFEGLGLTVAALAIVTLSAVMLNHSLAGVARAAVSFATTLVVCFVLFGPARLDASVMCDALSSNLIILAACGAAGVTLAHMARLQGASRLATFGFVGTAGAAGLALYGITEPACLGGPYAQVVPRLGPIWLDYVSEVRSLYAVGQSSPSDVLAFAGYPLNALGYGVLVVRGRHMPHAATYFAIFAVTVLLGVWQVRLLPYASFLSVPLIAIGLNRGKVPEVKKTAGEAAARAAVRMAPPMPKWVVGGAVTAVGIAAIVVAWPSKPEAAATQAAADTAPISSEFTKCTNAPNIKPLAALPKGLVANDIDLGSYIVAWTSLDVLSAPYHRMGRSILATHDLLHASASEAGVRMKALGARYIALCAALGDTVADHPVPGDALRSELLAGRVPAELEAVPLGTGNVKVWRLRD